VEDHRHYSNIVLIVCSLLIAGSIVFCGFHIAGALRHEEPIQTITAADNVVDDEADESPTTQDTASDWLTSAHDQIVDQITRQAKSLQMVEVSNIRITHNNKLMVVDVTYKPAPNAPSQTLHNVELTGDEMGRFKGALPLPSEKIELVVY
jgi:hypothetical protein